jgi:hypothetical protein
VSEPWHDYAGQTDGPWSDYDMTGPSDRAPAKKKRSTTLGIIEGVLPAVERLAPYSPANVIPGFKEADAAAIKRLHGRVAERERTQEPGTLGKIEGNLFMGLPVALATKNPFWQGAGMGALNSERDDTTGVAEDAVKGGLWGYGGGKVLSAASDALSPVIEPAVRRLAAAGVKMTPGMIRGGKAMTREDKAVSRPVVGEAIVAGRRGAQETFNRAAVDKALEPLGLKVPTPIKAGHDAVAWADDRIGEAYDLVIPHLKVNIDGPQFAATLKPVAESLQPGQRKEFMRLLNVNLKGGQLAGRDLKTAQGELRRLAGVYSRSQSAADQELGRALGAADKELTSNMMAQNPEWAPQLQRVNNAYRGYRTVADAASRGDEGVFNPGQLKQSVRRADFSKGKNATARGDAFMQEFSEDARGVIPARVPNSGTADRQPKNLFAALGGAKDLGFYTVDNMLQPFRLAPRPAPVRAVAARTRRLARPAGTALVVAAQQPND